MNYPKSIQNLVDFFKELPSVGPKTAERYVFYLLKKPENQLKLWASYLNDLKANTLVCQSCLAISETNPCSICQDDKRQKNILCLVESTQDMAALEATRQYTGKYFVLGGLINTIENIGPNDINIAPLLKKIKNEGIQELILALNFTLEGETTCLYLNKILKDYKMKISRLAKGLPAGSNLEYADEMTLSMALKNRNLL
ncbi:MAG: recombination mediator RecR [Candidatus Falkowbacteria bacterium]|nr:recombination mediator RecR [Candidatus Falkowbacteria bacterium]